MPPKLVSDNGEHIVIRPLAYVKEKDLARYAELKQFPIIPCNLCGSQPNLQRQVIKEMLNDWDKRFPGRIEACFQRCKTWCPRTWPTPIYSTSNHSQRAKHQARRRFGV